VWLPKATHRAECLSTGFSAKLVDATKMDELSATLM